MKYRLRLIAGVMFIGALFSSFAQDSGSSATGTKPTGTASNTGAASAGSTSAKSPLSYSKDEFPSWALDLRRAEIVAFGALPFTVFFTQIGIDIQRFATNGWDQRYAPWPLKPAGAYPLPEDDRIAVFATGIGLAIGVALADFIILAIRRQLDRRGTRERSNPGISVKREAWPLVEQEAEASAAPEDS